MQYQIIGSNPFAVLTAIVVDRTRVVYADLAATEPGTVAQQEWLGQLHSLRLRGHMLLNALRLFYAALGLFAATALISVAGSMAAYYGQKVLFEGAGALSVLAGASAVGSLSFGCIVMVRETRLAMESLAEEARIRTTPR